jgi:hypothetical protein
VPLFTWCSGAGAGPDRTGSPSTISARKDTSSRRVAASSRPTATHRAAGQKVEAQGQVVVHEKGRALVLHRRNLAGGQIRQRGVHHADDAARPGHCPLPMIGRSPFSTVPIGSQRRRGGKGHKISHEGVAGVLRALKNDRRCRPSNLQVRHAGEPA